MEEDLKSLDNLFNEYDAFIFTNKYGELKENSHNKDFKLLYDLFKNDDAAIKAIDWIRYRYDCYYKEEYKEDSNQENAFNYLKNKVIKIFEMKEIE